MTTSGEFPDLLSARRETCPDAAIGWRHLTLTGLVAYTIRRRRALCYSLFYFRGFLTQSSPYKSNRKDHLPQLPGERETDGKIEFKRRYGWQILAYGQIPTEKSEPVVLPGFANQHHSHMTTPRPAQAQSRWESEDGNQLFLKIKYRK